MASLDDLQTNLINATNSMTALTTTVSNQIGSINTTVANKINELNTWRSTFERTIVIEGTTVLTVGVGKMFSNIQDAFNEVQNKVIKGDILIKVDDGTYNVNSLWLGHCPSGSHITLEGNKTNPSNCVINLLPDSNRTSHGVIFDGVNNIKMGGFKIVGSISDTNMTHRCVLATNGSVVDLIDNTIIIDGGWCGIYVDRGSRVYAHRVVIKNCCRGVFVINNSSADVNFANISSAVKQYNNFLTAITQTTPTVVTDSIGLSVNDSSNLYAGGCTLTGYQIGVNSNMNSYCWCDCITISNTTYAMISERQSMIWSHRGVVNGAIKDTTITDCRQAFSVSDNSYLFCNYANVSNITDWVVNADMNASVILPGLNGSSVNGCRAFNGAVIHLGAPEEPKVSERLTTSGVKFVPALNTTSSSNGYITGY